MIYSYTQISQYLTCPRRYRYRYLDGWKQKDTRAAMLFGRAFEQALGALFRREDPGAVPAFVNGRLPKTKTSSFRTETPGIGCCSKASCFSTRFCQDDRVRIRQPRAQPADQVHSKHFPETTTSSPTSTPSGISTEQRCLAGMENHFESIPGGAERAAGSGSATGLLLVDDRDL